MFLKRFRDLAEVQKKIEVDFHGEKLDLDSSLISAHTLLKNVIKKEGKVVVIANGGSAGIASHFCCDLIRTLHIPAQTLFDSNLMTCMGNDFGYENVFSKPLQIVLKEEDLLVAISSSGKSLNIVNACNVAIEKNASLITLSGFKQDNLLRNLGELNFWVPSLDYGLVEMTHFFILHTLIDTWNIELQEKISERKIPCAGSH